MNRNIVSLSFTTTISSFTASIFWTILPLYMWDVGFTLMDIAVLFMVQSIVMVLFARFFGLLSDRYGKKRFIFVEFLLCIFAYLLIYLVILLGFPLTLTIFIIFYLLMGFAWSVGSGAFIAAVTTSMTREYTGRATGIFLSFDAIGWTIGSFVSGFLVDIFGLGIIFFMSFILMSFGAMIFFVGYVEESSGRHIDFSGIKKAFRDAWVFRVKGKDKLLVYLYSIVALLNLGSSLYFLAFIIKFYIIVETKTMYGIITGIAGIFGMITPYLVSKISDSIKKEWLLVYPLAIRIVFMFYLSIYWDKLISIIFWVVPLWGIINLALISLTTDYAIEGYESEAQAIRNTIGYVSSSIGNLIGGLIAIRVNLSENIMAMSKILIIGSSIYFCGLILAIAISLKTLKGHI